MNSQIKQLEIIVSRPFWQTFWFALLVFCLFGFLIWLIYRIQWSIRMNHLKIATETRKKAAADFHDELGHRLTKISLFVESIMLQKEAFPSKSAQILKKIQDNANALYFSTRDFIWAMNPSKDSAMDLLILLRDFGVELFEDTSVDFSVEGIKEEYNLQMLNMDLKRQLVMIFKEAMNNALKHSNCTEVVLKFDKYHDQLEIVLTDNGRGFVLDQEKFGYGQASMFNRSDKVRGQLEINTKPGMGTEVLFKI